MPTDIKRAYQEQGYSFPVGLTWDMVAERRERWAIPDILVSIAVGPGCLGWGVPYVAGRPLEHP
jgi:hypothetical protein